jgi:WD40 repeat protein
VSSVAFSPNGRHIVSGSWDKTVRIWDSESQQQIGHPLSGHAKEVSSVAFSPNGRHIVSGSWDKTVCIWDSESQQQIGQPLSGHADPVSPVAFSPNAGPIISGSQAKKIHILDADGQQQITKLHSDEISSLSMYPLLLLHLTNPSSQTKTLAIFPSTFFTPVPATFHHPSPSDQMDGWWAQTKSSFFGSPIN